MIRRVLSPNNCSGNSRYVHDLPPAHRVDPIGQRRIWRIGPDAYAFKKQRCQIAAQHTGGPRLSCEMIILQNNSHGGIIRVCKWIFTTALRYKNYVKFSMKISHLTSTMYPLLSDGLLKFSIFNLRSDSCATQRSRRLRESCGKEICNMIICGCPFVLQLLAHNSFWNLALCHQQ